MSTEGFCGGLYHGRDRAVGRVDMSVMVGKYAKHFQQGPRGAIRVPEGLTRFTTQGIERVYGYIYRVFLDPEMPKGYPEEMVRERLKDIWHHERGWQRAGLWVQFTRHLDKAQGVVKITSDEGGNEGCGQCRSCSCVHTRSGEKDRMYLLASHLQSDFVLNHEGGHMFFDFCDMYLDDKTYAGGGGYGGVMDYGSDATSWPTAHDIFDAHEWLEGRARFSSC